MNTPNKLTLLRVLMIPAFMAVFLLVAAPWGPLIAAAIYALASATDAIDGHLARKNNQITDFGNFSILNGHIRSKRRLAGAIHHHGVFNQITIHILRPFQKVFLLPL